MGKGLVVEDKPYEEKLEIARAAYKQIIKAIEALESQSIDCCAHWNGCITVDGVLFYPHQLREG